MYELNFDELDVVTFNDVRLIHEINQICSKEYEAFKLSKLFLFIEHCEAFIAGGFAFRVLDSLVHLNHPEHRARYVFEYLQHGADIDVFFPNQRRLKDFQALMSNSTARIEKQTEFATTYSISGGIFIQAVHVRKGPIGYVLSSFDIANACVALQGQNIFLPHGYNELYGSGHISVLKWQSDTVHRIRKWCNRHKRFIMLDPAQTAEYMQRMRAPRSHTNDDSYLNIAEAL